MDSTDSESLKPATKAPFYGIISYALASGIGPIRSAEVKIVGSLARAAIGHMCVKAGVTPEELRIPLEPWVADAIYHHEQAAMCGIRATVTQNPSALLPQDLEDNSSLRKDELIPARSQRDNVLYGGIIIAFFLAMKDLVPVFLPPVIANQQLQGKLALAAISALVVFAVVNIRSIGSTALMHTVVKEIKGRLARQQACRGYEPNAIDEPMASVEAVSAGPNPPTYKLWVAFNGLQVRALCLIGTALFFQEGLFAEVLQRVFPSYLLYAVYGVVAVGSEFFKLRCIVSKEIMNASWKIQERAIAKHTLRINLLNQSK